MKSIFIADIENDERNIYNCEYKKKQQQGIDKLDRSNYQDVC